MPVAFAGAAVLQEVADAQQVQAMARPAGAQTGDLLVLAFRAQTRATSLGDDPQVSGFSRVTPYATSGSTRPTMLFTRRIAAIGSEPESYDVWPTSSRIAGGRRALALFLLRGARVNAPAAAVSPGENGNISGSSVTVDPLDSPSDGSLQVTFSAAEVTDGLAHVPNATPAGHTTRAQLPAAGAPTSGSRTSLWVGTKAVGAGLTAAATTTWQSTSTPTSVSIIVVPEGTPVRLPTPMVTKVSQIDPSSAGQSDGSMTVSFTPVDGASSYTAHRANKLNPAQSDFTQVASGVTSPYTATGLPAGPVSIGIRAEV